MVRKTDQSTWELSAVSRRTQLMQSVFFLRPFAVSEISIKMLSLAYTRKMILRYFPRPKNIDYSVRKWSDMQQWKMFIFFVDTVSIMQWFLKVCGKLFGHIPIVFRKRQYVWNMRYQVFAIITLSNYMHFYKSKNIITLHWKYVNV